MRIGIDAHAIGSGAGGNETYMRELVTALAESQAGDEFIGLLDHGETWSPGGAVSMQSIPQVPAWLRVPLILPWVARRGGFDLLHTQYVAPFWCPCPSVVSVHDIGWVRFPEFFPPLLRRRLALLTPGTLRRAARIFVLTEAIRTEIAEVYGVPHDKMDVVSPGVDPRFFEHANEAELHRVRVKHGLPERFVLYVGAVQPRKNLVRLARAFAKLREQGAPQALVVTGERTWLYREVLATIESLGLNDRLVFTGYVDSADLPTLIQAADAFAYVSLYEGFGLPVLESMASGTPCVVSTDPAISEVARDAAYACDPLDEDAIQRALTAVLTDDDVRNRLRTAGPERALNFTRQAMAEAALAGYRKAFTSP